MKNNFLIKFLFIYGIILILAGCALPERNININNSADYRPVNPDLEIDSSNMILKSEAFAPNGNIPSKYTCDGENINPPLEINGVPKATLSLVLIVDDPDAPSGDWVHWTVWNIDPAAAAIAENSVPSGSVEGITDFGRSGWGGPCPPSGAHRYQFKLYALDITLDLDPSARKKELEAAIAGHILDQAMLVGRYQRN